MKKLLALTAALMALLAGRGSAADNRDLKYFTVDERSAVIKEIPSKEGFEPGPVIPGPDALPMPPDGPQINPPDPGSIPPDSTSPGGMPPDSTSPGGMPPGYDSYPGGYPNNYPSYPSYPPSYPMGEGGGVLDQVNGTVYAIDNIVNLMEKVWGIIEKNQPVVNITTNYANAVPYGTSHWSQLQGWSKPATKRYSFAVKNAFGREVVKVTYQVHYTYGGNFRGIGKFLTGVTVEPLNIVTAWGYKVSMVSEVPDSTVANVGTHQAPVASMQVQLKWVVHNAVKDTTSKAIYYVQGDGFMQEIGAPSSSGMAEKNMLKVNGIAEKLSNVKFN